MIGTIIYILGIVAAVWCVLDIFKHNKLEPLYKVLLSIAVVAFINTPQKSITSTSLR